MIGLSIKVSRITDRIGCNGFGRKYHFLLLGRIGREIISLKIKSGKAVAFPLTGQTVFCLKVAQTVSVQEVA